MFRFSTDLTSLSHELLPCQADVHTRLSAGRAVLPSKVFLLSGTIIPTSPTHRGHSAHNREHTRRISRRHRKQAWQSRELSARRGRSSRADWWSFHEHFLGTSLRVPCRYVSKFQLHCIVEGSGSLPVLQSRAEQRGLSVIYTLQTMKSSFISFDSTENCSAPIQSVGSGWNPKPSRRMSYPTRSNAHNFSELIPFSIYLELLCSLKFSLSRTHTRTK